MERVGKGGDKREREIGEGEKEREREGQTLLWTVFWDLYSSRSLLMHVELLWLQGWRDSALELAPAAKSK